MAENTENIVNKGVSFFSKEYGVEAALSKSTTVEGSIVFDKTSKSIFVAGVQYGGSNLSDASFGDNVLKIWKVGDEQANPTIKLDFSSLATTTSVMAVFKEIADLLGVISVSPEYATDGVDAAVAKVYTDNAVNADDTHGDAILKIDTKLKATVDEIISNEEVTAANFGSVKDTVGMNDDYSITFTNDLIKDQTTVKGAIEKLATDAGKVDDVKIGDKTIVSEKVATIAVEGDYNPDTNKIATQTTVSDAIDALDYNATDTQANLATVEDDVITIATTIKQVDGVIDVSGTQVLAAVAKTGSSSDVTVNYGTDDEDQPVSTNVQSAVTSIDNRIKDLEALPTYDTVVLGDEEELPTAAADTMHKIYLKPFETEDGDAYEEYITVKVETEGEDESEEKTITYSWEKVGTTAPSLEGYVKTITIGETEYEVDEDTNNITFDSLTESPVFGDDKMSADVYEALNETNKIDEDTNYAEGITKLDNKAKVIVDEILKNEKVAATMFSGVKETVGMKDDLSIEFANELISDQTTVKGAIEALADASQNIGELIESPEYQTEGVMTDAVECFEENAVNPDEDTVGEAINKVDTKLAKVVDEIIDVEYVVNQTLYGIRDNVGLNDDMSVTFTAPAIADQTTVKGAIEELAKGSKLIDSPEYQTEGIMASAAECFEENSVNPDEDTVGEAINKVDTKLAKVVDEIIDNEDVILTSFEKVKKTTGLDKNFEISFNNDIISDQTTVKGALEQMGDAVIGIDMYVENIDGRVSTLENTIQDAGKVDDVKVGGTSVLNSDKEAIIAVDGTYNASTNKVATVSSIKVDQVQIDGSNIVNDKIVNIHTTGDYGEDNPLVTANSVLELYGEVTPADYDTDEISDTWAQVIEDNVLSNDNNVGENISALDTKISGLSDELIRDERIHTIAFENVQKSAGFNAKLNYVQNEEANYIHNAESLADADDILDSKIKDIEDSLTDVGKVDDVKVGGTSVLNSYKEAIIAVDGEYNPETNKIATMSSINNAIKLNETAGSYIPEDETELFDEDVVQSLNSDNKLTTDDTVAEAIEKLDKKGKTIFNEIIINEEIVNNTFGQVQKSTGLNDYFEYIPDTTTAYINDAQSLKEADKKLDDAIKAIAQKQIDVADGEKILSVDDDNAISSTLTINIEKGDDNKEYIVLKGIDNAEVSKVDASAFVKDGMITSINWKEGSENVLVITWNSDSDKTPTTTEVDMSKFIDTYTSGNETALTVNSYVITPNTGAVAENAGTLTTGGQVYTAIAATKGQDIQTITGETAVTNDTYVNVAVTATKGTSDDNYTLSTTSNVVTKTIADATDSSNGLALAKDVKDYFAGSVKTIKIGDDSYTVSDNTSEVTLTSLSVSPDYNTESVDETTATALNVTNKISDTDNYAEGITKLDNKAKVIVDEIIKNEEVTATLFTTIQNSVGLTEGLEYEKQTTSNYIADATSFADADKKLDEAIKAVDNKVAEAGKVDKVQINGNDIVANKIANIAVDGTYDDATNKIATVSTITDAIANIAEATENGTDAGVKVEVKTAAGSVSSVDVAVTAATVTYTPNSEATGESEATDINLTASDTTSVLNGASIEQIKAYIDAMVAAKVAQVTNSGATIPVNNATATKIAEVDGTEINAKVSLVWEEYE